MKVKRLVAVLAISGAAFGVASMQPASAQSTWRAKCEEMGGTPTKIGGLAACFDDAGNQLF
jgi:hypothetical protein